VIYLFLLRDVLKLWDSPIPEVVPDCVAIDAIFAGKLQRKIPSQLDSCAAIGDAADPADGSTNDIATLFKFASPENALCELQSEDKALKPVIDFLMSGVLPEGDDKLCRRLVFEKEFYYLNENSVLCRTNALGRKDARSTDALFEDSEILVLPDSVVDEVLHAYHDSSHYGIARLRQSKESSASKSQTRRNSCRYQTW